MKVFTGLKNIQADISLTWGKGKNSRKWRDLVQKAYGDQLGKFLRFASTTIDKVSHTFHVYENAAFLIKETSSTGGQVTHFGFGAFSGTSALKWKIQGDKLVSGKGHELSPLGSATSVKQLFKDKPPVTKTPSNLPVKEEAPTKVAPTKEVAPTKVLAPVAKLKLIYSELFNYRKLTFRLPLCDKNFNDSKGVIKVSEVTSAIRAGWYIFTCRNKDVTYIISPETVSKIKDLSGVLNSLSDRKPTNLMIGQRKFEAVAIHLDGDTTPVSILANVVKITSEGGEEGEVTPFKLTKSILAMVDKTKFLSGLAVPRNRNYLEGHIDSTDNKIGMHYIQYSDSVALIMAAHKDLVGNAPLVFHAQQHSTDRNRFGIFDSGQLKYHRFYPRQIMSPGAYKKPTLELAGPDYFYVIK
jgi:hypothetical protein